jgi:hypothetical protein
MEGQMNRIRISLLVVLLGNTIANQSVFAECGLLFDGTNCRVAINNSARLNLGSVFTLEAWVYPQRLTGRQDLIYKWGDCSYLLQLRISEQSCQAFRK